MRSVVGLAVGGFGLVCHWLSHSASTFRAPPDAPSDSVSFWLSAFTVPRASIPSAPQSRAAR